jgi:GT2 family glycosyltransferase
VVLLNSDVEVTENWLPPLLHLLEADSSIAACQPKVRSYNQRYLFEYAGGGGGFIDAFGYPFSRGRLFDELEEDTGQYDAPTEVFWAIGASMCIRTELFQQYQLDEYFFAHMEEIDLCWRLKNLGYKIAYTGASTVYHLGGGTLAALNPRKTYFNFRNGLFLLYKNLPGLYMPLLLFIRMSLDGIAALRFLVKGEPQQFKAIWKAHIAFYKAVTTGKVKREKLKGLRRRFLSYKQVWPGLLPQHYFLGKHKHFAELPGSEKLLKPLNVLK